jgi:pre-mRNA-splicing factor 38B
MKNILETDNNSLVRAIGFLYLRYTCPPNDLWKWFETYLEDEEEIYPSSNTDIKMSIGAYCIKLLTDMSYYNTTLPRIPVPTERKIKVMLLLLEEKQKRGWILFIHPSGLVILSR